MRLLRHILSISAVVLYTASCNESNFASSNGKKSDAPPKSNELDEEPKLPEENPDDCVDGDKINFNWTGDIKTCIIDEGKTYNFESKKCAEMRKAEFDCDWDNIKSAMNKRGLSSSTIENDSAAGAKLVSCGQSKDGNRIVAQWVKLPEGKTVDCTANKTAGLITTGCYTLYVSEDPPEKAETKEEEYKQVFDCMNTL